MTLPVPEPKRKSPATRRKERLAKVRMAIARAGIHDNSTESELAHRGLNNEFKKLAEDPSLSRIFREVVGRLEARLKAIQKKKSKPLDGK